MNWLMTHRQTPSRLSARDLPDSGPGSAGYLVVVADYGGGTFVESNAIPITKWKGKITYTERLPGQDPAGPGIRQITYDEMSDGAMSTGREKSRANRPQGSHAP